MRSRFVDILALMKHYYLSRRRFSDHFKGSWLKIIGNNSNWPASVPKWRHSLLFFCRIFLQDAQTLKQESTLSWHSAIVLNISPKSCVLLETHTHHTPVTHTPWTNISPKHVETFGKLRWRYDRSEINVALRKRSGSGGLPHSQWNTHEHTHTHTYKAHTITCC